MSDRQIQEAVAKLAGRQLTDEVYMIPCSVVSVDIDTRTCNCVAIGGEAITDIEDVRLMAEVDDGILYTPAIDSTVVVAYSKRNVPYIALYSEISAIHYVVGNSTVDVTNDTISFNGGALGGLIKIADLVNKLNNLENLVNDLIQKYNEHTHQGVQSGGETSGPTLSQETESLTPTIRDELENTSITHGES